MIEPDYKHKVFAYTPCVNCNKYALTTFTNEQYEINLGNEGPLAKEGVLYSTSVFSTSCGEYELFCLNCKMRFYPCPECSTYKGAPIKRFEFKSNIYEDSEDSEESNDEESGDNSENFIEFDSHEIRFQFLRVNTVIHTDHLEHLLKGTKFEELSLVERDDYDNEFDHYTVDLAKYELEHNDPDYNRQFYYDFRPMNITCISGFLPLTGDDGGFPVSLECMDCGSHYSYTDK